MVARPGRHLFVVRRWICPDHLLMFHLDGRSDWQEEWQRIGRVDAPHAPCCGSSAWPLPTDGEKDTAAEKGEGWLPYPSSLLAKLYGR